MTARLAAFAVVLLAIVTSAAACADHAARSATLPSAAPSVSACEGCHASIAAEWRTSFHRIAFVDDTFQRSLALEAPREHAFCTRCHAPAADRAGVSAGVDCISCHGAPHADAGRVSASAGCAACHEFAFDGRPELVQKTVSEHAVSAYAGVSCTTCHMPSHAGHADHRFLSGHAPAAIARAAHVDAARIGTTNSLRVAIRVEAGHAFPTGDMFRRARLVLFAEGTRGQIVADAERTFGRTWGGVRGGAQSGARTQESDTRIRGLWQEVIALDEPTERIARVRWSLIYERVIAMRGPHVEIASSDVLAEGEIAW